MRVARAVNGYMTVFRFVRIIMRNILGTSYHSDIVYHFGVGVLMVYREQGLVESLFKDMFNDFRDGAEYKLLATFFKRNFCL